MKLLNLRNIAVIYSASEKVVPEVEELKKYANENNVQLNLRMIQTLVDLPAAVTSVRYPSIFNIKRSFSS